MRFRGAWGHCAEITPGSALRGHPRGVQGSTWVLGSNEGRPRTRQMPYSLSHISSPNSAPKRSQQLAVTVGRGRAVRAHGKDARGHLGGRDVSPRQMPDSKQVGTTKELRKETRRSRESFPSTASLPPSHRPPTAPSFLQISLHPAGPLRESQILQRDWPGHSHPHGG